jgi:hypothetical protein
MIKQKFKIKNLLYNTRAGTMLKKRKVVGTDWKENTLWWVLRMQILKERIRLEIKM